MVVKAEKFLGHGLYTIPEAALYARVRPAMIARWLFGTKKGKAVIDPEFGPNDRVVSFLDLIQTLAIREIRIQKPEVTLQKFRQAIQVAREKLGISYPFAQWHCTFLYGEDLVIKPVAGRDEYFQVTGKEGQGMFSFVETYLENLDFGKDGLASEYRIYKHSNVQVLMNPNRRLGEPLLPSGYSAEIIFDSIRTEGSINRAAKVYGISLTEAEAAYQFVVNFLNKPIRERT